jgi:hypothetical protein
VSSIAITVAFYLFFLAGGTGVLAFELGWLQNIAAFISLTYFGFSLTLDNRKEIRHLTYIDE